MSAPSVLGIGNVLMDISVEAADGDLEKLGMNKGIMHLVETPRQREILSHFSGKTRTTELGGSALNVIRIMASLGTPTGFIGMVGDDDFGGRILERMAELGIKPLLARASDPTGSCVVLVTPDGERTMNTHLGTSRHYNETHIPHDEIAATRVVHIEGYQWDTEGQKNAIRKALETAHKNGAQVSLDLADPFAVERSKADFLALIGNGADIIFANKDEACMLYDSTAEEAARRIAGAGALAIVKLGADGALIRKGEEEHRVPAEPATVVDTNGAGDIFAAGFLHGYVNGRSLPVCGKMAAILAADVIGRIGVTVSDEALAKVRSL